MRSEGLTDAAERSELPMTTNSGIGVWVRRSWRLASAAAAGPAEDAAFRRAVADYKAGRLRAAIPELQTVVRGAPDLAPAHGLLGYLYLRQGQMARAIPELKAAVKLTPGDTSARNNLGDAYLKSGNPGAAIIQYRAALAQTPQDNAARLNLADALTQAGRYADAVTAYRAALGADSPASAWQNLGYALQKEGKVGEAAAGLLEAAQRDPKNPRLWQAAGMLASRAGPSERAMAADALTKALALGTGRVYEARFTRGEVFAALGKAPEAAADFGRRETASRPVRALVRSGRYGGRRGPGHRRRSRVPPSAGPEARGSAQAQRGLGPLLAGEGSHGPPRRATRTKPTANGNRRSSSTRRITRPGWRWPTRRCDRKSTTPPPPSTRPSPAGSRTMPPCRSPAALPIEAMGDLSTALAAFRAALVLDPHNAQAENDLGVVYEKQGDNAQALAAYRKAAALAPSLPEPRKKPGPAGRAMTQLFEKPSLHANHRHHGEFGQGGRASDRPHGGCPPA